MIVISCRKLKENWKKSGLQSWRWSIEEDSTKEDAREDFLKERSYSTTLLFLFIIRGNIAYLNVGKMGEETHCAV